VRASYASRQREEERKTKKGRERVIGKIPHPLPPPPQKMRKHKRGSRMVERKKRRERGPIHQGTHERIEKGSLSARNFMGRGTRKTKEGRGRRENLKEKKGSCPGGGGEWGNLNEKTKGNYGKEGGGFRQQFKVPGYELPKKRRTIALVEGRTAGQRTIAINRCLEANRGIVNTRD